MKSHLQRTLAGLWLLFLGVQPGFATGSYPAGNEPYSIVAADVNGDGWPDLICADSATNTLTVLTNNGAGIFTSNAVYLVGLEPVAVTVADVNGDGWPDLICANNGSKTLTVLTNHAGAGFVLASTLNIALASPGTVPEMVVAADVNGDGWPDLISANEGATGSLTIFTNNGSGGFVLSSVLSVSTGTFWVAAADVNGDGWQDLISPNFNSDTLSVFTNNRSGGFVLASMPAVGVEPFSVAAVDVNGDHHVDLISANLGGSATPALTNSLTVLTNNGSGVFGLHATYVVDKTSLYSPFIGSSPLTAADINGDGKVDLIYYDTIGHEILALTNNGSGAFGRYSLGTLDPTITSLSTADVNGDGRPDVIYSDELAGAVVEFNLATFPPATSTPKVVATTSGLGLIVSWPSASSGWSLQQVPNLTTAAGSPAGYDGWPICDNGTNKSLFVQPVAGNIFFRLLHP